jgi:hypothetical protein
MMQASEKRLGDDTANGWTQRETGTSFLTDRLVRASSKHLRLIEPTGRSAHPFCQGQTPRGRPVTNAHRPKATDERITVDGIAVTDQVSRCCFPTIGFGELARDPFRHCVARLRPATRSATVVQYQQPE